MAMPSKEQLRLAKEDIEKMTDEEFEEFAKFLDANGITHERVMAAIERMEKAKEGKSNRGEEH